ncbi:MAG TPA: hypothetical protein VHT97_05530 [Acidimicrobiales bacterium]|nr:hypothetical protein [Acidimicrobiales bacterium]
MADTEFSQRDRVEATQDLAGVPEGTPGRVMTVVGLTWVRYRVHFDNGVELSVLDGRYLRSAPKKKHAHT